MKVSTESIVSVNGKKTAATNFSKLQVGDVLELTFQDDRTIWKAVVIENGGDTTGTWEPRRLVRTPNPWWQESPGESPANGERPTVPPVRCKDHEHHAQLRLKRQSPRAWYVCMPMYVYDCGLHIGYLNI